MRQLNTFLLTNTGKHLGVSHWRPLKTPNQNCCNSDNSLSASNSTYPSILCLCLLVYEYTLNVLSQLIPFQVHGQRVPLIPNA